MEMRFMRGYLTPLQRRSRQYHSEGGRVKSDMSPLPTLPFQERAEERLKPESIRLRAASTNLLV